eukprot:CAMPEP_0197672682 /NCGR_PEP_ID=MMETSP1338-20131121/79467_1 /TAXON_ID=43686 ORGANISM="Pelagodinium beii, Strain RCC1491" /NCGR_SAMPLE_ID=MMETSP1338 /ASSEMBLY_ACC=CAM_ASM_000754 /LENGTH=48 /DNA_ID= /DNA_START= /DNA_END= /DNA_ORIENTATION=
MKVMVWAQAGQARAAASAGPATGPGITFSAGTDADLMAGSTSWTATGG